MKRILLSLLVFALIFAGIQGAAAQDSDECNATLYRSEEMNISVPATLDFGNLTVGGVNTKSLTANLSVSNGTAWNVDVNADRMKSACGSFILNDAIDVDGNPIDSKYSVNSGFGNQTAAPFEVVFHQAIDWADKVTDYSTIITFTASTA